MYICTYAHVEAPHRYACVYVYTCVHEYTPEYLHASTHMHIYRYMPTARTQSIHTQCIHACIHTKRKEKL